MNRANIFWGVVLLLGGALLLLDNLGLLGDIEVWSLLWPLFLIAVGVWILLGAAMKGSVTREHISIPLEGAQNARVRLQHGAGKLNITSYTSAGILLDGDFSGKVKVNKRLDGNSLDLKLQMSGDFFPFDWSPGQTLDWSFGLTKDVPLNLELETGASENQIDLTELNVSAFSLKSGASSTLLKLPSAAKLTRVKIESGAASVKIVVPEGVAARIRSQSGLSSLTVNNQRFQKMGNTYQSPDYDSAEYQSDIDIQMGVGSVEVQ